MSEEKENVVSNSPAPSEHLHDEQKTTPAPSEFSPRAITGIIGCFLSLFVSVGFMNAFGVFQEYYHQHQLRDKSEFDIAWIGSFASFMLFASAAPAGLLVDKIGPTLLLSGGSVGMVLGVFMTSLCDQYYQFFLAQGLLVGCSMAFLTVPCVATLSKYFDKHRGMAVGFCISGSSMGGVIWPIVCDQLLHHRGMSFGWTMRICGFIMIPIAALAIVTVRSPPAPVAPLDGDKEGAATEASGPAKKKTDISILKKPTYLVFVAGTTIFNLGMFSPFFFTTGYSVSLGHSASFSFYVLSIMNGASLFGRVGVGMLADKFGAFNLTSLSALVGAIVCYCWTTATSVGGIVVWSMAYGFSSGAILSLQMQCAAAISTKETHGTAIGLCMAFASVAGLVGTPISGELIPHGYLALSMYAASTLLAASFLILAARLMQSRELRVKV